MKIRKFEERRLARLKHEEESLQRMNKVQDELAKLPVKTKKFFSEVPKKVLKALNADIIGFALHPKLGGGENDTKAVGRRESDIARALRMNVDRMNDLRSNNINLKFPEFRK